MFGRNRFCGWSHEYSTMRCNSWYDEFVAPVTPVMPSICLFTVAPWVPLQDLCVGTHYCTILASDGFGSCERLRMAGRRTEVQRRGMLYEWSGGAAAPRPWAGSDSRLGFRRAAPRIIRRLSAAGCTVTSPSLPPSLSHSLPPIVWLSDRARRRLVFRVRLCTCPSHGNGRTPWLIIFLGRAMYLLGFLFSTLKNKMAHQFS